MARISFPDGRWVDIAPMLVNDELALADLAEAENDYKGQVAFLRGMRDLLDSRITATSWGSGAGSLTKTDMYGVFAQWRVATEDDALPPADGTSSETT